MREINVDFPGVGKPDQPDVGQQLQLEAEKPLFAGPTGFGSSWCPVGGADELRVPAAPASALRDQDTLALFGQVREQAHLVAFGLLVDERADGHGHVEIVGGLSCPIGARPC